MTATKALGSSRALIFIGRLEGPRAEEAHSARKVEVLLLASLIVFRPAETHLYYLRSAGGL
jgi:hypothetical protein